MHKIFRKWALTLLEFCARTQTQIPNGNGLALRYGQDVISWYRSYPHNNIIYIITHHRLLLRFLDPVNWGSVFANVSHKSGVKGAKRGLWRFILLWGRVCAIILQSVFFPLHNQTTSMQRRQPFFEEQAPHFCVGSSESSCLEWVLRLVHSASCLFLLPLCKCPVCIRAAWKNAERLLNGEKQACD